MFGRFLPQEPIFFDYFEQHARLCLEAAQLFLYFMSSEELVLQENPNPIKSIEHQADRVTFNCVETLHKSFITPFQHDDIFRLISRMDDIVDGIDEVYDDCLIYKVHYSTPAVRGLASLLVAITERVERVVKALRNRKKLAMIIRETCLEIDKLESEADQLFRKAMGQLFEEEQEIRSLIKWKEIYGVLEQTIDYCKDVSNIIEGIMLDYD